MEENSEIIVLGDVELKVSKDENGRVVYDNGQGGILYVDQNTDTGTYTITAGTGETTTIPIDDASSTQILNAYYRPNATEVVEPKPKTPVKQTQMTLDIIPDGEFDISRGNKFEDFEDIGIEGRDKAGNRVIFFKKKESDASDADYIYYAFHEDGELETFEPSYEEIGETDFGQTIEQCHVQTTADIEATSGPTTKSTFYNNGNKSDKLTVEFAENGQYVIVDDHRYIHKKFTPEEFAAAYPEYYCEEAYYDEKTGDMVTMRHYGDGRYCLDVYSGDESQRISKEDFSTRFSGYQRLETGESTIFVDGDGRLHQVEYNGNTFIDTTDPTHKITYTSLEDLEDVTKPNNWQLYQDPNYFEVGFQTSAGLFFCAELKYAQAAEYFGALYSLFYSLDVDSYALQNAMITNGGKDCSKLSSIGDLDPSLSATGIKLANVDNEDLYLKEEIFEAFQEQLKKLNDLITDSHKEITKIRKNLSQVDDEFSEQFRKEYNYLLQQYIKSVSFNENGGNTKQVFFSGTMINLLDEAMDAGLFYGTDLEVIRAIRENSDFEQNASGWDKFWKEMAVCGISFVEGFLNPIEAIIDGVLTGVAFACDLVGARDASNTLLEIVSVDGAEYLYDMATAWAPECIAQGNAHTMFYTLGDITGDVVLWSVGGPWGVAINTLKMGGEASEKVLQSGDFSYDDQSDRTYLYLKTGQGYLTGYATKKIFKSAQKRFAKGKVGASIFESSGYGWYTAYVHTAQAGVNGAIQLGANGLDMIIDTIAYGGTDGNKIYNNLPQAIINGLFAPNKDEVKVDEITGEVSGKYSQFLTADKYQHGVGGARSNKDGISSTIKIVGALTDMTDDDTDDAISDGLSTIKSWTLSAAKPK